MKNAHIIIYTKNGSKRAAIIPDQESARDALTEFNTFHETVEDVLPVEVIAVEHIGAVNPTEIVVSENQGEFHARLKDNEAVFACGSSADAAIGNLMGSYQSVFNQRHYHQHHKKSKKR